MMMLIYLCYALLSSYLLYHGYAMDARWYVL